MAGAAIDGRRAGRVLREPGLGHRGRRGIIPIVGPVILGSIAEVEERTMALEARGFTRPGRRTLLWAPPDSGTQALVRWALVAGLIVLIVARIGGWLS